MGAAGCAKHGVEEREAADLKKAAGMAFKRSYRPGSLSSELARAMRKEIEAGGYAVGEKLPAEAELSQIFDVSRSVVREAIALRRSDGLVGSRQGAGAFVLNARRPRPFRIDPALILRA